MLGYADLRFAALCMTCFSLTVHTPNRHHNQIPMEEIAFTMQLKPGVAAEYERRHDEIWPELSALLTEAGIRDYSIYLDAASGVLFAVQKRVPSHTTDGLPTTAIMQRRWAYMGDLMETNPDSSPVVKPLARVFHME